MAELVTTLSYGRDRVAVRTYWGRLFFYGSLLMLLFSFPNMALFMSLHNGLRDVDFHWEFRDYVAVAGSLGVPLLGVAMALCSARLLGRSLWKLVALAVGAVNVLHVAAVVRIEWMWLTP